MRNTRSAWPTPVTRSKVTAVALVAPTVPARVAVRAGAAAAVGVRAARTEPGAVTASVAISTASTIRRASLGDLIARDTSTRSGSRQHFRGPSTRSLAATEVTSGHRDRRYSVFSFPQLVRAAGVGPGPNFSTRLF